MDRYFLTINEDFNNPNGALLGLITAAFSIGAVIALPLVPFINDRYGRKACILFGSAVIAIGVVLQTAAVDSKWLWYSSVSITYSYNVEKLPCF